MKVILRCNLFPYPYYRGPGNVTRWSDKQREAKRYKSTRRAYVAALALGLTLTVVKLVPRRP